MTEHQDPRTIYDKGKTALKEARFEEALECFDWFFNNSIKIDKSFSGVRLSYLLADWAALGGKYPKALDRLREVQATDYDRLLKEDCNKALFIEWLSINRYLKEENSTLAFFQKLDQEKPALAAQYYNNLLEETLIRLKAYQLCKKYLGSPDDTYAKRRQRYLEQVGMSSQIRVEIRKKYLDTMEKMFKEDVSKLCHILDEVGRGENARELWRKASEEFPFLNSKDSDKKL